MRRGNLYISIYINLDPKKQTCFIFASTWTLFAPRSKCKAEHETVKSIWQLTRYHAGSSRQKEKMPALSFTDRLLCTKLRVLSKRSAMVTPRMQKPSRGRRIRRLSFAWYWRSLPWPFEREAMPFPVKRGSYGSTLQGKSKNYSMNLCRIRRSGKVPVLA